MGVLSFIPFLLSQGFFRRQSKPVQAFGPHSFKSLGSSFYVEVPVRRVPGARLVLFNRRLAESLDLPVPKGGREIESALLEWFAWFKHESRAGEGDTPAEDIETFFATRYQDSDSRCAGSALGDGRALWLGEIVRKTADDRMRYLDVVVKGIGATPLAWLKHPKKSHRDGMVGLTEAVHEYVYSLAAVRNGIDAAQVLAVIELPFQRAAGGEKAALVVRVGNHLRFAHYRYFSNQPERLETLFEYGLKRDMGLPLDYPVGRQDARAYLDRILAHLAEEAAAYYDLHAVHGSPTFGNRTSDGASIDLSTFVYLDAHHAEYRYMPGCSYSLGGRWGQHEQLFVLFSDLMKLLRGSRFKYADTVEDEKRCWEKFRSVMESRLTQSWLKRVAWRKATSRRFPQTPSGASSRW
ncbi:protein adenylyltransferase SelO family protein [Methylogaea oryzae]|uniref:protein adenylyltransferase SelO family protein n=1 Tax=Methylogaea oryzae TaxID=1295382 RepID=UPI0009E67569|nr:protein adenylyltransferase SelO family protein [Methylogaea oryzae]